MAPNRIPRFAALMSCLTLSFLQTVSPVAATTQGVSSVSNSPAPSLGSSTIAAAQTPIQSVWAPSLFAFPVVRQPARDFTFVSTDRNTITQFGLATEYDNIGLLAHNYLAGRAFFDLKVGKRVYIVHESGHAEAFTVTRILQYQALDPENPFSDFRDLENNIVLSAAEMFTTVYTGRYHVTLQTCIARGRDDSWGRLFVIAEPERRRGK